MALSLGSDIGGTFTDFALVDTETGDIRIHKRLTTPSDPSEAVENGVAALMNGGITRRCRLIFTARPSSLMR